MNTPAGSKQEVLNMPSHLDIAGGDVTPPSQASGDDLQSNLSPERQACDLERAFMVAFRVRPLPLPCLASFPRPPSVSGLAMVFVKKYSCFACELILWFYEVSASII